VRRKNFYLAWLALHFFFIVAVCAHQVFWLIASGLTIIPAAANGTYSQAEKITSTITGQKLPASNPAKVALFGYLHSAGIEGAYGFFAPNVPENFKLAFEFRNADGRADDDLPNVESRAAALRLGSLLDKIGRSDSEQYRRILIRMLTSAAWKNHPDAISAHAVFGKLKLPNPLEYERGVRPAYEFIAAYDFEQSADPNAK
jgi:hypothetical protein